ncbi:MAG: hypothetical protein GXP35_13195 [Actinobacteria bacterium]|nr:hypothetical protein [Actinomycetota bacterium]
MVVSSRCFLALVLLLGACSSEPDRAAACSDLHDLLSAADQLTGSLEFLEPQELSDSVATVIATAAGLTGRLVPAGSDSATTQELDAALREVEIDGLEYRRTLDTYGYDLLVAQTAGSTEEQERLYVFESGAFVDARMMLRSHQADSCAQIPEPST